MRFFIEVRVLEQQARKGENRRERRAQLVAHDGEKLAFISRFLMQFIERLFQLTLLIHKHVIEHARFFGLLLHFTIQVGAQALKMARHGVEIARELGKFVFASDARRRVELVIEIARFDIMRRLRETLNRAQQQAICGKENAEASDRNHDKHHKRLLRDGCRNAFFVDAHRLGNGHSAANVAYLHALFRVAILVDFSSRLTVALKARLSHIQRLGIAEHALARFLVGSNTAIRSEARIGAECIEGLLLKGVGCIRFLPGSFPCEPNNVVGVACEQRAHRLSSHYAHERFRAEIAILVSVDDILVHVDKIPHGAHLGSKHLGLFPSFVLGLRALEAVIPQRIGAHEYDNKNDYDDRHFAA